MMSLVSDILIGLIGGLVAGVVFFGGLRWTVGRLPGAKRPALLATVSFIVRSVVLAAVLVIAGDGELVRILVAVVGILVVRSLMVRSAKRHLQPVEETPWI